MQRSQGYKTARLGLLAAFSVLIASNTGFAAEKKIYLEGGSYPISEIASSVKNFSRGPYRSGQSKAAGYYLTQAKGSFTADLVQQLQASGAEIIRYIPDDAYLVKATPRVLEKLSLDFDVAPYKPELRYSSELKLRNVFNRQMPVTLRLQVFPSENVQAVIQKLEAQGVVVQSQSGQVVTVLTTLQKVEDLSQLEEIEWIAKKSNMQLRAVSADRLWGAQPAASRQRQPKMAGDFTDLTGFESGVRVMNFDSAWNQGFAGEGQVVAVADTGLDTGVRTTLAADFANFDQGFALGYGSKTWADFVGHGTHVAGSVGGVGALSGRLVTGGAQKAKIISQSLWSQAAKNLTTPDDLRDLFDQAYRAGARIHTNSWGDPDAHGEYNMETSQVDDFVWNHPDMVILFAAGNDGVDTNADGRIDAGSVSAPATSKNVISVGASENLVRRGGIQSKLGELGASPQERAWPAEPIASDTLSNNPNGIAAFSSRGPTLDGRLKPDLVAPGTNILSNCSHTQSADEMWGRYNKDYCFSGGTSMATPLAAGAAALVRERLMTYKSLANPSAALVKAVLLHSAVDLYPGQFGEVGARAGQELLKRGPNPDQGYGRLDIGRAVGLNLLLIDSKVGLATGEQKVYVPTKAFRKVTLVYTDAPAAAMAARTLVNNLDLEVQVGDQVYRSASAVDNTEQVVLPAELQSLEGVEIRVKGTRVAMGKNNRQPYALVYSPKM